MATVYRGDHASGIGMVAAVKKLHPHLAVDHHLRQRLRVEAQALARLRHPNIVQLLDFVDETETCALITELVEGQNLREVMRGYRDGPMPMARALLIVRQVLRGLAHAHKKQCLHRDIKPGNIMVTDDNKVKLLDFGIGILLDTERLTVAGVSIGTPVYMAPEQIESMDELDERTDIYALGVTLWELLAGPGARPIGQRGWRLDREGVEDLEMLGVPRPLIDVVLAMTHADPDVRLASCNAVLSALDEAAREAGDQRLPERDEDGERTAPMVAPRDASGPRALGPVPTRHSGGGPSRIEYAAPRSARRPPPAFSELDSPTVPLADRSIEELSLIDDPTGAAASLTLDDPTRPLLDGTPSWHGVAAPEDPTRPIDELLEDSGRGAGVSTRGDVRPLLRDRRPPQREQGSDDEIHFEVAEEDTVAPTWVAATLLAAVVVVVAAILFLLVGDAVAGSPHPTPNAWQAPHTQPGEAMR